MGFRETPGSLCRTFSRTVFRLNFGRTTPVPDLEVTFHRYGDWVRELTEKVTDGRKVIDGRSVETGEGQVYVSSILRFEEKDRDVPKNSEVTFLEKSTRQGKRRDDFRSGRRKERSNNSSRLVFPLNSVYTTLHHIPPVATSLPTAEYRRRTFD